MNKFKKIFVLTVLLVSIFYFSSDKKIIKADKIYVDVSVDDQFDLNSVCILLQPSVLYEKYTVQSFKDVGCDYIEEINYTYNEILKKHNGQSYNPKIDNINLNEFYRDITLYWNREKTKEEIIEIIHKLEKRDDIYCASPNYIYEFQSNKDVEFVEVPSSIWQNFYRFKVVDTDEKKYYDENGDRIFVLYVELIKSYDKIAGLENELDTFIDDNFNELVPIGVTREDYKMLKPGYEYIMKLDTIVTVRNKTLKTDEYVITYSDPRIKIINIFDDKLFFTNEYDYLLFGEEYLRDNKKEIYYTYTDKVKEYEYYFTMYVFKRAVVKGDVPFEFEIVEHWDNEYIMKMDPEYRYIYKEYYQAKVEAEDYIYITEVLERIWHFAYGIFLRPGDDSLMFDEYIKLAGEVYRTGIQFEEEDCLRLRKEAEERIQQNK